MGELFQRLNVSRKLEMRLAEGGAMAFLLVSVCPVFSGGGALVLAPAMGNLGGRFVFAPMRGKPGKALVAPFSSVVKRKVQSPTAASSPSNREDVIFNFRANRGALRSGSHGGLLRS